MANDLVDAVVELLEATPAVTTAFGDTWNQAAQTGVAKFFTDVVDQVPLPWCQIVELGETYDYMTIQDDGSIPFTSPGQMLFSVYAADRYQTRTLGMTIATALRDPTLIWPGTNLMMFRIQSSRFQPVNQQVGPGVPIVFNRIFIFDYMYSGDY